tara:strand:+ start:1140 stop:1256 length:117 start_codon:yes stop_codon:yes gene_type:complete
MLKVIKIKENIIRNNLVIFIVNFLSIINIILKPIKKLD